MAIVLILGRPGAGKSYTAIEQYVLPAIKQKRRIIHNISGLELGINFFDSPLFPSPENITIEKDGKKTSDLSFNFDKGFKLGCDDIRVMGGDLIILDEYHIIKNRYQPSSSTGRNQWQHNLELFLRAHRHYTDGKNTTDIIIMTQTDIDISPGIKQLAEKTIICKASIFGGSELRRLYYDGFSGVQFAKGNTAVHSEEYKPRAKIYKYYKSYTAGMVAKEAIKGFGLYMLYKKSFLMFGIVVFSVVGSFSILKHQYGLFGGPSVAAEVAEVVEPGDRGLGYGWECAIGINRECLWWSQVHK